ncbi:DNA polymerase III subunit delta [Amphibacillus sediminis]|uniref:DNA polymerase III subunit delta n=1 Tax=Amphibacillus sediminis TaxID=360185 RepID=UPI00082D88FB|nr:DNA polymerase III subunit delta [Amphibacillus sediminis]
MTYLEAIEEIRKQKKLASIYLIYGQERYLIEQTIATILNQVIDHEDRDDNVLRYDLMDVSIEDVLLEVETYPFFGSEKVVIANYAYFLTAKQEKAPVEHNLESLLAYINNPVDFSTLILIAPYEKLDERKKITKTLKKQAFTVQCEEVKSWHLDKWITHLSNQYGIALDQASQDLLMQEAGTNLALIEKEIEKLALAVGDQKQVSIELAKDLIAHQGHASGLKLVDTVMEQDLIKAISTFRDLIRVNEEPIALLALLASQLRTLYQVKILKQKGYSQKQMAQQLKVHPYVIKMASEREKAFSLEQIYQALNQCTQTDSDIKQGKLDKSLAFELLLYRLIERDKPVRSVH